MRGFAFAILLLVRASSLDGQAPVPFSTLEIVAAGAYDASIDELGAYWNPSHGGLLRIATPFHVGVAAASIQTTGYHALAPEQPDFRMHTAAVEWSLAAELGPMQAFAGVHAGAAAMSFDEQQTDNANENEFLAGVQLGITSPRLRGVGATLTASRRTIFTRIPIHLTTVAIGLGYTFSTPAIVRAFLE